MKSGRAIDGGAISRLDCYHVNQVMLSHDQFYFGSDADANKIAGPNPLRYSAER
jgi:hypothetical protein